MKNIRIFYSLALLLFPMAFSYAGVPIQCEVKAIQDNLILMFNKEQDIRVPVRDKSLEYLYKPSYKTWIDFDALIPIVEKIDHENQDSLELIVKQCGWIDLKKYGKDAASSAFSIVHHAQYEYRMRYFPFIQHAFENGEIDNENYAMFIDRNLIMQKLPQRYATQMKNEYNGKEKFGAVEEPSKLNARRAEMGMDPISEFNELSSVSVKLVVAKPMLKEKIIGKKTKWK